MSVHAQNGFLNTYSNDFLGMSFNDAVLYHDTIIAFGGAIDSFSQNIHISKIDSTGQLLETVVFRHPDTLNVIIRDEYEIITTTNDEFIIAAHSFETKNIWVLKVDRSLNLIWFSEIEDPSAMIKFPNEIVEIPGGFLIAGYRQNQNFDLNLFVSKIDHGGEFLWEKQFGSIDSSEFANGLVQISDTSFVLSFDQTNKKSLDEVNFYIRGGFLTIDTSGALLSTDILGEYNSTSILRATYDNDLNRMTHLSSRFIFNDQFDLWIGANQISQRDTNFIMKWIAEPLQTPARNLLYDLIETNDDNFIACGRWVHKIPTPDGDTSSIFSGGLFKVDQDGSPLWQVTDTVDFGPGAETRHFANTVLELSSGNLLMIGRVDRFAPGPAKSFGWITKYDANGCRDTLCAYDFTTSTGVVPYDIKASSLSVFPNPTDGIVYWTSNISIDQINVFDVHGQSLMSVKRPDQQIDLSHLPTGIYYLEFWVDGKRGVEKVVVH